MTDTNGTDTTVSCSAPACLDDIITANRHRGSLRLASPEEIAALNETIIDDGKVRHILSDCRLIALSFDNKMVIFGTGVNRQHEVWSTTEVSAVDRQAKLFRTTNSLYRYDGELLRNEPSHEILVHIAAKVGISRLGRILGLGD